MEGVDRFKWELDRYLAALEIVIEVYGGIDWQDLSVACEWMSDGIHLA